MEIAVDLVTDLADKLRSDAKRLEEDKAKIRQSIETLQDLIKSGKVSSLSEAQRDDALCNLNRAYRLSETVQVSINLMTRDPAQTAASREVNNLLSDLEKDVKRSPSHSRQRVMSYMNACCSNQTVGVPPDEHFGAAIVGCTLDDQKQAKKRIEMMLDFVDHGS
ncbi:BAG family molecular chaperone regulator 2 [Frankliniella occidentalis]|uniref:BAG family molecular chaperone regulator 2 n=1 Tax=Frankliniella occidentalis TaxID=133901 RepID=A0A6J1T242_FRAOC|nr:BAG family molecular chaperone regulator 2 [Frankliniella occidentalis]XP_026287053.1 BAG family molecular chaperone regulator 2 [Frankliniella occidentalis]XP_052126943.1 BAG family molecular chaperone regulator 2 [Frankliniella occidentalis]